MRYFLAVLSLAAMLFPATSRAQQVPDTAFVFDISKPAFPSGKGPVITIDAAHGNFHTLEGRYAPFGKLLSADGWQMRSGAQSFTPEYLDQTRILLISNPLDSSNLNSWALPTPSAFSAQEIAAIKQWVENGGRLFLIADHMPFAGAATELGRAFGFEFLNGFAFDNRRRPAERFFRGNGSLQDHEITRGKTESGRVDTVISFTGSAFRIPKNAEPILVLRHYTVLMPAVAWEFGEQTPWVDGDNTCQGAVLKYGKGRVAVFGEAAMFSAQLTGPNNNKVGMNRPEARQNAQLLLNVVHWLNQD